MLLKITAGIALRKRLTKSVNQKLRSGNEGLKSVFCFPITHQDKNSHLFARGLKWTKLKLEN